MHISNWVIVLFLVVSCSADGMEKANPLEPIHAGAKRKSIVKSDTAGGSTLRMNLDSLGLVDVTNLNSNIRYDIKYFSEDNFMHLKLYHKINRPILQRDVALRLSKCQKLLSEIDTGLHLLILDAIRPVSVQWKMWNSLDTVPTKERIKFVSNPINKSLHNYGAAVDLTICTSNGNPLDMGAGFDDIREIAYPSLEKIFLEKGLLTKKQVENRILLRKIMKSQGFRNLPTEWWHFNACSREQAKKRYSVLETEF